MKKTAKFINNAVSFAMNKSLIVIITTLIISAVLGFFSIQIKLNPDFNTLLPHDDQSNQDFIELFNNGDFTDNFIVLLTGDDLYDPENLEKIQDAIIQIESYENIGKGIHPFSFITASKKGTRLAVTPMNTVKSDEEWTVEAAEEMKARILADEIAKNLFLSEDGTSMLLYFPAMVLADENSEQMKELRNIVEPLAEFSEVSLNGGLLFTDRVMFYLQKDLIVLLVICFIIIMLIYYLSFGAKRSVFLPMAVVVFGAIWSMGIVSLLGFELTIINIITPVLILTLGSSYSIHLLSEYFRTHPKKMACQDQSWILEVVSQISNTVITAGLTTIAGFLSLLVTRIPEFRQFGISTSIGIFVCVLLTLFYMPAVLSRLPNPKKSYYKRVVKGRMSVFIKALANFVIKRWIILISIFILTIGVFVYAYPRVFFETSYVHYFPQEDEAITGLKKMVSRIGGMDGVYITIDAPEGSDKYFLEPENLQIIDTYENAIRENISEITHTLSFPTYVRFFNNIMTGESEIPDTRGLIMLMSRYIGLISETSAGNSDLELILDETANRITIAFRYANEDTNRLADLKDSQKVIDAMGEYAADILPEECNYTVWGQSKRFLSLSNLIAKDQRDSTVLSIVIVFFIAWVTFKSLKYGIMALLPILFGIMTNYIFMYAFSIPFDMVTIAFASVTVGVGIDDAVHFILRFKTLYFYRSGSLKPAIKRTIELTGRPIILTTLSIIGGLLVLTLASFIPIKYFGFLISIALMNTLLATLFILPSGLILWIGTQRMIQRRRGKLPPVSTPVRKSPAVEKQVPEEG